jgi:hypothetical protein
MATNNIPPPTPSSIEALKIAEVPRSFSEQMKALPVANTVMSLGGKSDNN